MSLPPHSSHKLQPLDREFVGSLQTVHAAEFDKWMHNHPRLGSPQSGICRIFRKVYEKVANMKITNEPFQVTGLQPLNADDFFFFFNFQVHHPRCVGSIKKNFLYYTYS